MNPTYVFAVEVSGVCNLESFCAWCPMHNRPRVRTRGLMDDAVLELAKSWVGKLQKVDALALHGFGEPLLHPRFVDISKQFAALTPITVSTNGVLLDEKWADELAKIDWAWISVSPWKKEAQEKAIKLLSERGIRTAKPPGVTHNWAGQTSLGSMRKLFNSCPFLEVGKVVIRWNGDITTCCVTDRPEDVIGHVKQEPRDIEIRGYDICKGCHHNVA